MKQFLSLFSQAMFLTSVVCATENHLNQALENFISGSISGATGMVVYTPFHYFQNRTIQKLPIIWNKPHYWFRGLPSLALGKAPTIAVQITSYEALIRFLKDKDIPIDAGEKMVASTIAGSLSGVINNSTHLIALHQENVGTSFLKTLKNLPHKNLTRGLGTTILREALFATIFLNLLKNANEVFETTNPSTQIARGLLSGGIVALTTQPFMVVSARLYADIHKESYKHGLEAAYKIFAQEGLKGFYKGCYYRSIGVTLALPVFAATQNYLKK